MGRDGAHVLVAADGAHEGLVHTLQHPLEPVSFAWASARSAREAIPSSDDERDTRISIAEQLLCRTLNYPQAYKNVCLQYLVYFDGGDKAIRSRGLKPS